ncbi:MAG: TIGR01459 family HAD-type hydrolase [Alphaproteobacteria bacterium]|nr:TIGR01459 family HAD-type hydrolase [Alphaproteobacteria bacterium]
MNGLSSLVHQYDLFFIDLWGVTHNGKTPFPEALECYQNLKKEGKPVFILSNAPRMPEAAIKKLSGMGLPRDLYNDLQTSGYECHKNLRDRSDAFYQALGTRLYHVGPERDRNLFTSLEYTDVTNIDDADFVLVTGTDMWDRTLESYQSELDQALQRNLPLVCANPDKRVLYGDEIVLCSGAIAAHYQSMGGKMRQHGKPDAEIYQILHSRAQESLNKEISKDRILMIGDSLATDIAGANAYGIDSLMVLSGIHGGELLPHFKKNTFNETLKQLGQQYNAEPTYVAEKMHW